jgi:hypothetical protein
VAEHVDETGGDRHAARIDLHGPARCIQSTDARDAIAGDRDIGDEWRSAAPVVDVAAAQDQFEGLLGIARAAAYSLMPSFQRTS